MKVIHEKIFAFMFCIATKAIQAQDSSSGCGPGWYVLKDNSLLSSSGRVLIGRHFCSDS
jgi:hypothetical protein